MRDQAQIAIDTADVIIFITDARQGLVDADSKVADMLRKSGKPVVLAVTVGDKNISEFCEMSIRDELKFIAENEPNLTEKQRQIGGQIMKEIRNRLQFLQSVGLDYLTLARAAGTLSGGESQRIRLTTQIGSALSGVLYVLDEPSIGLHQRDNDKLIATLKNLRDLGNTVIVVEHLSLIHI